MSEITNPFAAILTTSLALMEHPAMAIQRQNLIFERFMDGIRKSTGLNVMYNNDNQKIHPGYQLPFVVYPASLYVATGSTEACEYIAKIIHRSQEPYPVLIESISGETSEAADDEELQLVLERLLRGPQVVDRILKVMSPWYAFNLHVGPTVDDQLNISDMASWAVALKKYGQHLWNAVMIDPGFPTDLPLFSINPEAFGGIPEPTPLHVWMSGLGMVVTEYLARNTCCFDDPTAYMDRELMLRRV